MNSPETRPGHDGVQSGNKGKREELGERREAEEWAYDSTCRDGEFDYVCVCVLCVCAGMSGLLSCDCTCPSVKHAFSKSCLIPCNPNLTMFFLFASNPESFSTSIIRIFICQQYPSKAAWLSKHISIILFIEAAQH